MKTMVFRDSLTDDVRLAQVPLDHEPFQERVKKKVAPLPTSPSAQT